jgi:hypothetical protein
MGEKLEVELINARIPTEVELVRRYPLYNTTAIRTHMTSVLASHVQLYAIVMSKYHRDLSKENTNIDKAYIESIDAVCNMFYVTYSNLKDEYNEVMESQGAPQEEIQDSQDIQDDEPEPFISRDEDHSRLIVGMGPSEVIRHVLRAQGELEDNLAHYNQAVVNQQQPPSPPPAQPIPLDGSVPMINDVEPAIDVAPANAPEIVSMEQYVFDVFLLGGILFSDLPENLTPRDLVNRPEYITLPFNLEEAHFHPSYAQNPNRRRRYIGKYGAYRLKIELNAERMYINPTLSQAKFTRIIMNCSKHMIDIWYGIDRPAPQPPQPRVVLRMNAEPDQSEEAVAWAVSTYRDDTPINTAENTLGDDQIMMDVAFPLSTREPRNHPVYTWDQFKIIELPTDHNSLIYCLAKGLFNSATEQNVITLRNGLADKLLEDGALST